MRPAVRKTAPVRPRRPKRPTCHGQGYPRPEPAGRGCLSTFRKGGRGPRLPGYPERPGRNGHDSRNRASVSRRRRVSAFRLCSASRVLLGSLLGSLGCLSLFRPLSLLGDELERFHRVPGQVLAPEQVVGILDGAVVRADDDPGPNRMVVSVVELIEEKPDWAANLCTYFHCNQCRWLLIFFLFKTALRLCRPFA